MSQNGENKPLKTKKRRRNRAKRIIRRAVKLVVLLAVIGIAGLFGLKSYIKSNAGESEETTYARAVATRGEMEETVYGTGTTSARSQPNVLAEADGTLTDLRVSVGDAVQEGDILAVLTNDTLDDEITDLEFALWDLDDTILGTQSGSAVTVVEAPAAGRVMAIYAQKGDDALAVFRREGALAIISTDGRMKVELTDVAIDSGVALGDTLTVRGWGYEVTGTVTDLTRQGTCVTVTILDDTLPMGDEVTVSKADGTEIGTGTLEVNKPMAVSSYGGTIRSVSVEVGDEVSRRQTLFRLEDSPLSLNIEDLRIQRETAAKDLEEAKEKRENLIILAPCDGTVASLEVSEGDEITSGTLIGSILEGEDMNLTIAVDELDVVEVEVGQKVTITVDALGDAQMEGEVYKIAPVGTSSGGVATYDVELAFEAAGTGVRSGMNATGEIIVASKEDALYVPVEALMTIGNDTYVMVESSLGAMPDMGALDAAQDGETDQAAEDVPADAAAMAEGGRAAMAAGGTASMREAAGQTQSSAGLLERIRAWLYEGVDTGSQQVNGTLVKVETGMQNDDYVEILSGLNEGDVVLYTGSADTAGNMMSTMVMMPAGGGSGRDSGRGGMPGGF
ncbi:MAG TPA: HlyD family efflux transporter periplasmic adaptor subunit [Candidatus Ventricola gallistercoris]|nr:HlyD family efflux transporter periplasmic adaptor subunit [Candidatus Ventricola gallistercoris]